MTVVAIVVVAVLVPAWGAASVGQDGEGRPEGLRVQVEVAAGAHFVGEGFELGVAVVGAGRRPEVDPPRIPGAEVWAIRNNEVRPISVSGIGGVTGESNVFVSRYRVVPRRAGTLEIPSIRARLGEEAGRSRPARVVVRPVPAEGRPAAFLGGVGRFSVRAEASPRSVRVGQELEYRITVDGPAAWGMTGRPDLKRFDRVGVGLEVRPRPIEASGEPPSRSFLYRLRPTRAGDAVLPPVAIAAYDPSSRHYISQVTPSVPIRVSAVRAFDAAAIPDLGSVSDRAWSRSAIGRAVGVGAGVMLGGAAVALVWARRRARGAGGTGGAGAGGAGAARRFAARMTRELKRDATGEAAAVAEHVTAGLIRYLQLGDGRPPGALTPDEAGEGVLRCTGSDEAGAMAADLAARCDGALYRDVPGSVEAPGRLREDARHLFARLARRS